MPRRRVRRGSAIADWSQPREAGLIGRCLRDPAARVLVNDVHAEPDYRPTPRDRRTCAPSSSCRCGSGDELWGVINVEELEAGRVRRGRPAAGARRSPTRSAPRCAPRSLYEQLERAYLGTAEALAAALEAKDAYTADHARSIVEQAEAVGRRLGLGDAELRDLRFGAVFHDIGKIAVPEAILDKPGPLTARGARDDGAPHDRRRADPRARSSSSPACAQLVRHEHERWDGAGYPDGLAGEDDPARLADHPRLRRAARDDVATARTARALSARGRASRSCAATPARSSTRAVVDALLAVLGAPPRP